MANYNSNYTGLDLDKSIQLSSGSIAEEFSSSKAYAVGDLLIHYESPLGSDGGLYKCIVAHSAGAWNAAHFERIKVSEAIAQGGKVTGVKGDSESTYRTGDVNITLGNFGVNARAAELNKLSGATVTTTEINYLSGASSNIQTQLNGKEATANRVTSVTSSSDDAHYPTAKAVYTAINSAIADAIAASY